MLAFSMVSQCKGTRTGGRTEDGENRGLETPDGLWKIKG